MKKLSIFLILVFLALPVYAELIDEVVATVNGEVITLSELERILVPVHKRYEQIYTGEELRKRKEYSREQLLEQLIENKLILQKAKDEGIGISEAFLEENLAEVKEKFGSEKEFVAALKDEGTDIEKYKEELEKQLIIRAMMERAVVSKAKPKPKEIIDYYSLHEKEFVKNAEVRISHILIKLGEDTKKLREEIDSIYAKLEKGEDFGELAKKYSQGPRAENGGDLGFISEGQLKPELEEVIKTIEVGKYSKIIETKQGYHIILVKDRKEERFLKLSEIWDGLEDKLFRQTLQIKHKEWVDQLKEKAHIEKKE